MASVRALFVGSRRNVLNAKQAPTPTDQPRPLLSRPLMESSMPSPSPADAVFWKSIQALETLLECLSGPLALWSATGHRSGPLGGGVVRPGLWTLIEPLASCSGSPSPRTFSSHLPGVLAPSLREIENRTPARQKSTGNAILLNETGRRANVPSWLHAHVIHVSQRLCTKHEDIASIELAS